VLFYVYPLKFLWSVLFSPAEAGGRPAMIAVADVPLLFTAYGVGVMATFGILAALYGHAYNRRAQLELTSVEVVETKIEIYKNVALAAIGLVSVVLALMLGVFAPGLVGLAGFVYFAIGISEWLLARYRANQIRRLMTAPENAR
jgi:hypothetical protein